MTKVNIKDGVVFKSLTSPIIRAISVIMGEWTSEGEVATVTSASDGKHKRGSLHYKDSAIDIRVRGISSEKIVKLVKRISLILGPDYDVVLEPDHIHVEWDPK